MRLEHAIKGKILKMIEFYFFLVKNKYQHLNLQEFYNFHCQEKILSFFFAIKVNMLDYIGKNNLIEILQIALLQKLQKIN